jgi:glutamate-1-semialdehyde 2,1-aminomutase/spore coat polysaccharide biosynthesis protein SpsF
MRVRQVVQAFMTVAAIVQARVRSTRLPRKVLLELAGEPVLHHVLARCRAISGVDVVVCAVPDEEESAVLGAIAERCGALLFRGAEQDVLDRYLGAARACNADIVLRVTSDCPLIDPEVCADLLALRAREGADFAANNMPPSFPHGLDCEAFTADALMRAAREAKEGDEREHVTPWLRRAAHLRRANLHSGNADLAAHRWTLDYEEDLRFFRSLFVHLPNVSAARMRDVLRVVEAHPEIAAINASRRRA